MWLAGPDMGTDLLSWSLALLSLKWVRGGGWLRVWSLHSGCLGSHPGSAASWDSSCSVLQLPHLWNGDNNRTCLIGLWRGSHNPIRQVFRTSLTRGSHSVVLVTILRMRSYWQSLGGIFKQETVKGEKNIGRWGCVYRTNWPPGEDI